MLRRFSAAPYMLWTILFILVPVFMVLFYSLFSPVPAGYALDLDGYHKFVDPLYLEVLWRSIVIAFKSTLLCLLVGYPLALILSRITPRFQKILVMLIILPMWMNFLLRTYAWIPILGRNGLINTLLGSFGVAPLNLLFNENAVLLGMVYNFLPFMVLPIYTVLMKIDRQLIEAAEDLGADRLVVFRRIILPLSIPGLISGVMMVFMPAVSTFVISDLLGGAQITLIGNLIKDQFQTVYDWNFGSAISMILMVIILLSMSILNRYDKRERGVSMW
ncbi:MAG: ABC transporter permease [Syntrophomonadaceae bacterium]|nr:ABC transporter permease [Syntrophomonadaceae bacterium]